MKKIMLLVLLFVSLFTITGCDSKNEKSFNDMTIDEKVEYKMKNMSLDEKIAQMLIIYYTNNEVDDNLKDLLKKYNPGGFILMKENITTFDNTKKFVSDLKKYSDIPMIISIDQEGGTVQRLQGLSDIKPIFIPSMYTLGKTNNQKLAYDVGKVMAEQLRTVGVNVVFAPVLDIYSNENNTVIGNRSFGKTDEQVSNMAISLAKGLEDNGVIATYKHFPGHGDTDVDSHKDLPVVHKTYDEIDKFELVPFKRAIENDAKIIMISHLYFDNIETYGKPSSLSKEIITDILYKKLNYNGLVITDALNMGALTKYYSDEDIYTMAIEAGSDLILMPRGSKKTIEYIKKNISEDRINKSVEKILKFKYTYLSDYEYLDKSYLNNKEQQNIISKIGE